MVYTLLDIIPDVVCFIFFYHSLVCGFRLKRRLILLLIDVIHGTQVKEKNKVIEIDVSLIKFAH